MGVLTSKLILELIDRVSGPAKRVSASMTALTNLQAKNRAMIAATSQKLFVATAAAYGAAKGLQAPISAASQFETALHNIKQKADLSDEAIAAMGNRIRDLAPKVNKSALEVAKGLDTLLGFGLDPERAEAIMGPIGKAATAYEAQVDDLANAGFRTLDNLKVKASEFGKALDVMATAGKSGAFELKNMAQYFPELTTAAARLKMTGVTAVGRLSAALQIAMKGAGDASKAATNASNLMQKIISPETTKKFKEAGVDIRKELRKTQKEGGDIFEMIARVTNKAVKGDLQLIGDLFQDSEVQKFLGPLIMNIEEYKRIRDEALKASGVVEKDFAARMLTNAAQTEAFRIRIEALSISVGNALLPAVNSLMSAITPFIRSFEKWANENPAVVRGITAVAGGLIGLSIAGLLSKLALGWLWDGLLAVGKAGLWALSAAIWAVKVALFPFAAAFRAAKTALIGFAAVARILGVGGALSMLGKSALGILGPIGLLAAAGLLIYENWDKVKEALSWVNDKIKDLTGVDLYDTGAKLLKSLWEGMKSIWSGLLGWAKGLGSSIKNAIMGGGAAASSAGAPAVAGARAAGGPVRAGSTYLVGERGPELFRPSLPGSIASTHATVQALKAQALAGAAARAGGGSGGGTVNYNIGGIHVQAGPGQSPEAIAAAVERRLSDKLNQLSRGAYSDGAYS